MAHNDLGNTPLRAADIELIIHCFGSEQWSEHFSCVPCSIIDLQVEVLPRLNASRVE